MPTPSNDVRRACEPADATLDVAFETLYRWVAAGLADPRREIAGTLFDTDSQRLAVAAAEFLHASFGDQPIPLGFGELPVDDLDLPAALDALGTDRERHAADFQRVFGLVTCRECPPYETEYHPNQDPFFRAQQMADIAGFYRAFGLEPAAELRERPDHLTLELEFVALLLARQRWALESEASDASAAEHAMVCQEARLSFQQDHLFWWVPSFSLALRTHAGEGFFAQLGRILGATLPLDRYRWQVAPPPAPVMPVATATPDTCEGCTLSSQE